MKNIHKKLFDEYFKNFWEWFNNKGKLTDEYKSAYEKKLYRVFDNLIKVVDVETAVVYTFNVPFLIINHYQLGQKRKRKIDKYFLKTIDYYLENDVSEYKACSYVIDNYKELNKTSLIDFRNSFRRWYNNFYNKIIFPEIFDYLHKKHLKKRGKGVEIKKV